MDSIKVSRTVLGYEIRGELTALDSGYLVTLLGGCASHVGAVTAADPGGRSKTLQRPGHREAVVSERWAAALCRTLNAPVTVLCGVRYDGPSREEIAHIVDECGRLLEELQESLNRR